MKRLTALILSIALLLQIFPAGAFAAGNVLTPAQLSEAYSLTGLGREGRSGAFHDGMMPAASWNAALLRDWLDQLLDTRMKTACEVLSHASYILAQKKTNKSATEGLIDEVRALQLEAESLREELRYYRDQLDANSNLIAETKRQLEEQADRFYPSDRVRLSFQIDEAVNGIKSLRTAIVTNARSWEKHVDEILNVLNGSGKSNIGPDLSSLFMESGIIRETHTGASRVKPAASRLSRLSGAAGIASDIDVKVTVLSEGQIGLVFQTGNPDNPTPVGGENVKIRVSDVLNPELPVLEANPDPDTGTAVFTVNTFTQDENDVLHLRLEVDPTAAGYRDFVIEDLDVEDGEIPSFSLVPTGSATLAGPARNSNSADDPYCYMMSFAGKDIMNKEYDMVYSTMNDYALDIRIGIKNPAGKQLPQLLLRYYSNQGDIMPEVAYAEPTSVEDDPDQPGGKIYTYTGTWRQTFSPSATSDQRPAFCFGKDDGALTFMSQLVSMQSATDSPINEGTGPDGGIFGNVLGKGFSAGFSMPITDDLSLSANLLLPYTEYMPHLNGSPTGRVLIWVGSPLVDDQAKEGENDWKQEDVRAAQRKQSKWEKMMTSIKEKLKKNLGKDAVKHRGINVLKKEDLDLGWFWVATGRWELDNSIPDVKTKEIKLRSAEGLVLTYSYTETQTAFIPGTPIPDYVSITFGISCGFAMEHEISFIMVNGEFQNWQFLPVKSVTIDLCFMVAIKAGVGIEGFLDFWIRAAVSLDFLVNLSLMSSDAWSLVVTFAIDITLGATLIFTSVSVNFKLATVQLYPPSAGLLRHYMGAAGDEPEQESPTYGEPQSYPALAADAAWKLEPGASGTGSFSNNAKVVYIPAGGSDNGLFILDIQDGDIRWVNTDTGKNGTFSSILSDIQTDYDSVPASLVLTEDQYNKISQVLDRTTYTFNVYQSGRYALITGACAKYYFEDGPDKGLPIPNGNSQLPDDYRDNNVIMYVFLCRKVAHNESDIVLSRGVPIGSGQLETDVIIFDTVPAASTGSDDYGYDSMIAPEIGWVKIRNDDLISCVAVGNYGRINYASQAGDSVPAGATGFIFSYEEKNYPTSEVTSRLGICTDKYVRSADGTDPSRTMFHSVMRPDVAATADVDTLQLSFSWIAANKAGPEGDRKNLEFFDWSMNSPYTQYAVTLKEDISHFTIFPLMDPDNDPIIAFYSKAERNGFGISRERLHGVRITPGESASSFETIWILEDNEYDIIIPGGKYDITKIGDVPYIYWITAAPNQDGSEATVWQLWIVPYDTSSNTMADPAVFAEFTVPDGYENWVVRDLVCKGAKECYLTVLNPDSDAKKNFIGVLAFTPALQPSLNLQGAVFHDLALKSGDFEDTSLNVINDGNLAIVTYDVTMYDVSDGKETEVETVHFNTLDPSKNWLRMAGDDDPVMTGESVGYREEDYNTSSRQHSWVLSQDTYRYTVDIYSDEGGTMEKIDDSSDKVSTEIIMPGSDAGFTTAFKIPDDWSGTKTLRMRITAVSVDSNIARRIAQLSGRAEADSDGLSNSSVILEYRLDPKSGKLVLDTSSGETAQLLAGENGSLYAREIAPAAMDLSAEIHDLKVTHRVYRGLDGERWVDMTVRNAAVTGEELKLTCAVYADGSNTPTWLTLPLYPEATSSRMAHTYTMRLSDLVDHPENHRKLRVDLQIVGEDETAYANNEFFILLDNGSSPEPVPPPPVPPVTGDSALPWLNWLLAGCGLLLPAAVWLLVRRRKEGN